MTKARTADDIRREIAEHLVSIAGPMPAGTSTKEIFRHVETRLAHPEINGRMVKALWYREVKNIPAHIADHVRSLSEAKPASSFIIDAEGRIRGSVPGPMLAPIRGRVEAARIGIEISPSRAPYQGVATLRHWLLSLLTEQRPFRLTDLDRGNVVEVSGALAVLDRLEEWLKEAPGRPASLVHGPAMFADERGVRPLDPAALESFGVHPDADYDVAAYLARNLGIVTFIADGQGHQVFARASGKTTRAVENAAAYLALRTEPVRLGIWWGDSWVRERNPDGPMAAVRLRRLAALPQPAGSVDPYEAERMRVDDVSARELAPFQPLLNLMGRPFDSNAIGALLSSGVGDRMTVTEASAEGPRFVYFPYGPDYYGSSWALRAVGRLMRNQPDKAYGLKVEQRYAEALRGNVVHFERIRATIMEAGGRTASDRRRSSYTRLIVPFTEGRRRLAVSYTVLTQLPGTTG